jgi:sialate O-acetylesterase
MKSIINILSLFITSFAIANIHLPAIFADGMVLQNASYHLGQCRPKRRNYTKSRFLDKEYKVKAANDATFKITFKTPKEGGPYTISLKGYNK